MDGNVVRLALPEKERAGNPRKFQLALPVHKSLIAAMVFEPYLVYRQGHFLTAFKQSTIWR
jgi:hypothetical protein